METDNILELTKRLMQLRRGMIRMALTRYGLHPGQPELLRYIQQHPGCSQRQMAEDAGVTAASIAASFKRMENAGFIRRRADTADLRCNRVYLTERGERELAECMRELEEINRCMLGALSAEELDCLKNCLEKMTDCLTNSSNERINQT